MGGASVRQLQSRCKMYSCFCKSTKMYIQLRVPTYNHNYFVLHCCFGFSASARNDVTAIASSWLVNVARISAKVQIFQLALFARKKHSIRAIRAASFARIAPQDCLSRLCIDLTCKSFAPFTSFASGVNAPWLINRVNVIRYYSPLLLTKLWCTQSTNFSQIRLNVWWLRELKCNFRKQMQIEKAPANQENIFIILTADGANAHNTNK